MSVPKSHFEGGSPDPLRKSYHEALEGLIKSAQYMFNPETGGRYVPFQGNRFAQGLNKPESTLLDMLMSRLGMQQPFIQKAQQMNEAGAQAFPGQAETYMNPYQQQVTDRIAQMGNRNFTENILPALEAKFVRLGQHGGRQHREMTSRLARDVQGEISSAQGNALHQGYGQAMHGFNADKARQMHGAELESKLGALAQTGHTTDLGTLGEAAKYFRHLEERPLEKAEEEHRRSQLHPMERLAMYASTVHGTPIEAPHLVLNDSPSSMNSGDWRGLGMRGLSALGAMGGMGEPAGIGETVKPKGHRQGGPIRLNHYAPQYAHGGLVKREKTGYIRESDSGGQADDIDMAIQPNAYVWNATDVSLLGDGNTETGIKKLKEHEAKKIAEYERKFARSGITAPYDNSHAIKAKVSNGEYVMDARAVCAEGNGDINKGVKAIDKGRKLLRRQKGVKSILPPKAKDIHSYVKGR